MKTASSYSLGCPELSSGCVGTTNEKTQSFRGATPRQNSLCANLLILKGGDIAASISHPEYGVRTGLRRSPRPRLRHAAELCKSLFLKGGYIAASIGHLVNGVPTRVLRSRSPHLCRVARLCKSLIYRGGDIAAAFCRWWGMLLPPPSSLTNNEARANHLGFVVSGVRK